MARPIVLYADRPQLSDRAALAALGVRIVVQPHVTFAAAMRAVHDTLIALRRGTAPEKVPGLPDAEFIKRITRQADYDRLLATYMN